jgi:hypothetical protein
VDRRKQGLKRSVAVEASGMPLAALPAPAKHRDVRLLAAILDVNGLVGLLPVRPVVHVDAGYDWELCRQALADRGMAGQIAARVVPAPVEAGRRWVIECTHAWATSTASCAGAPSAGEATPVPPSAGRHEAALGCPQAQALRKSSRSALNWSFGWRMRRGETDLARSQTAAACLMSGFPAAGRGRAVALGANEVGKAGTIGELGLTLRRGNEQSPVGRVPRRIPA